ncbi:MAG: hypothetical protein AAB590_01920 [Patescibacteria group bacterium]
MKGNIKEQARIPDEDVVEWIRTLQEGGFSPQEIDIMMSNLNEEYLSQKFGKYINEEVLKAITMAEREHGRALDDEERKIFERAVRARLRQIIINSSGIGL